MIDYQLQNRELKAVTEEDDKLIVTQMEKGLH